MSNLYLGLDAGGSKTELVAVTTPASSDLSLMGPAANVQRAGPERTAEVIAHLILEAIAHLPASDAVSICVGVAGAGRAADRADLTAELERRLTVLTSVHLLVVDDATIALEAAHRGESGMIVISGTGSIVYARALDGSIERVGGWGRLLGDEGSGYAIGLRGLKAVASQLDGGPPTTLSIRLADRYGIATAADLVRSVYHDRWPIPQMAPLVLEAAHAGDEVAKTIIGEEARALSQQVVHLAARCPTVSPRLALLGGLTTAPFFQQVLLSILRSDLPGWHIEPSDQKPVAGALRLAQHLG